MSKRKSDKADSQPVEQAATQPGEQAATQQGEQADSLMKQLEARPRKRRPAAFPPEPIQLDPDFVHNPQRMQYALLLALLLRQKNGSATFAQKDLAHTDTDYNILFARTLDGRGLEVTVVSSASGIIRSPEKEREVEKWKKEQEEIEYQKTMMMAFHQLPPASPNSSTNFTSANPSQGFPARGIGSNLGGGLQKATEGLPVQFPPGANPGAGFAIPAVSPQTTAQVIQFAPNRDQAETTDGSSAYHFPFQVGANPQEAEAASRMDLSQVQQQLMAKDLVKDLELQAQELEAIERQERGQ